MLSLEKQKKSGMITRSSQTFMKRGRKLLNGPTKLSIMHNPVGVNKPKTAEFNYFRKEAKFSKESQRAANPKTGAASRTEDNVLIRENEEFIEVDNEAENSFKLLKVSEEKCTEHEEDFVECSGTISSSKHEKDYSKDYQGIFDRLRRKLQLLATESLTEEEKDPVNCRVPLFDILLKRLDCDPNSCISTYIHPGISHEDDSSIKVSQSSKKNDALATLSGPEGGGRLDISAKNKRITKIFNPRDFSLEEKWEWKYKSVNKTSLQLSISPLSSTEETKKFSWESSEEGAKVSVKHPANSFYGRKDDLEMFPEYSLQTGCYFWEQKAFDGNLGIVPDEWYLRYPNKELHCEEDRITLSSNHEPSLISCNEDDRSESVDGHLQWDKIASCSPSLEQEIIGFEVSEHIDRGWWDKEDKWDTFGTPSNAIIKMAHYDSHSKPLPLANILEIVDEIDHHVPSQKDSLVRTPLIGSSCKDYAFDLSFLADNENRKLRHPRSTEIFQQQVTPCKEFYSHLHATPVSDFSPNLRSTSLKKLENFHFQQFSPTDRPLIESPCDKFFSQDQIRMRESTLDEWAEDSFKASGSGTFQSPRLASFSDVLRDSDCWDAVSSDTFGEL